MANLCPKIINFDALDFSEWHFLVTLSVGQPSKLFQHAVPKYLTLQARLNVLLDSWKTI